MPYRWGFKTEAHSIAEETRAELGLGPLSPLDPRVLAAFLQVPILDLTNLAQEGPLISHLLHVEPEVFSAVTVFARTARVIVHNDGHALARQNSNLAHELSHALLLHPPTPALDDRGARLWDQDIEDEASWLAGALLVSEAAAIEIARGRWTLEAAARHFQVSQQMLQFRLNTTGAVRRVQRMRGADP